MCIHLFYNHEYITQQYKTKMKIQIIILTKVVQNLSIVSVRNSRVSVRVRVRNFIIIEYQYQFEMLEYQFEV